MNWTPTQRERIQAYKNRKNYSKRVRKAMALDKCEELAFRISRNAERDADVLDSFTMRLFYNIRTFVEQVAYEFGVDFYDIYGEAEAMCQRELLFALPVDKYFDVHPYRHKDCVGIEFYATLEWTHEKARMRTKKEADDE